MSVRVNAHFFPFPGKFDDFDDATDAKDDVRNDKDDSRQKYPVMVFIHGESFSWGSGNIFDGRVLATYGRVIVITFNYRLGVFGKSFLNGSQTWTFDM